MILKKKIVFRELIILHFDQQVFFRLTNAILELIWNLFSRLKFWLLYYYPY